MKAKFVHRCTHVLDKEASIKFYEEALGFKVVREMGPEDGSWTNTFMANDEAPFEIELTWNRGRVESYDNGGKDTHIAFSVDDFEAFYELHEKMVASSARIPAWVFISSPIPTASGSRLSRPNSRHRKSEGRELLSSLQGHADGSIDAKESSQMGGLFVLAQLLILSRRSLTPAR